MDKTPLYTTLPAASACALFDAPERVVLPFDHWKQAWVVVKGTQVEDWLHGRKVVEYELQSPDWKRRVGASKFAAYPDYGLAKRGLIGLQGDHPGTLSVRGIRVRALP